MITAEERDKLNQVCPKLANSADAVSSLMRQWRALVEQPAPNLALVDQLAEKLRRELASVTRSGPEILYWVDSIREFLPHRVGLAAAAAPAPAVAAAPASDAPRAKSAA